MSAAVCHVTGRTVKSCGTGWTLVVCTSWSDPLLHVCQRRSSPGVNSTRGGGIRYSPSFPHVLLTTFSHLYAFPLSSPLYTCLPNFCTGLSDDGGPKPLYPLFTTPSELLTRGLVTLNVILGRPLSRVLDSTTRSFVFRRPCTNLTATDFLV